MLEDHADGAAGVAKGRLGKGRDVGAVDDHLAGGGLFQAVDQADQGRLAGARAADHAQDRALGHGEIDILQRRHGLAVAAGKGFRGLFQAHDGLRRHKALGVLVAEISEMGVHKVAFS